MARGSAPGERRGGRAKGTPNKCTAEIKAVAQKYGAEAIKELVRLMRESENDQARIAAIKEILDRGYGKAKQDIGVGNPDGTPFSAPTFTVTFGGKEDGDG